MFTAVHCNSFPGGGPIRSRHLPTIRHDRTKRIGCLKNGAEDIKKHKWFRGLNWAALYNKQMLAEVLPELAKEDDTSLYESYPDSVEESGPLLDSEKNQALFDYWQ